MNPNHAQSVQKLLDSTSIYWLGLGLALVVMAVIVHRLRAWYRDGDDPADAVDEIVSQMEELNRRGDLSDEEIRSIKGQISGRQAGFAKGDKA